MTRVNALKHKTFFFFSVLFSIPRSSYGEERGRKTKKKSKGFHPLLNLYNGESKGYRHYRNIPIDRPI